MVYQKPLKLISKIGFGCGHILNDICATLWFGYGLIYMQVGGDRELYFGQFF